MHTLFRFVLTALIAASPVLSGVVHAGVFSVSPIKVELAESQRASTLTIRNDDVEAVTVQVDPMAWSQQDGQDVLEPTRDLVVGPPIFNLAPGAEQIVRLGRVNVTTSDREQAYRVILREVPPPANEHRGVRVALKLSLPVFIQPKGEVNSDLSWTWVEGADGLILRVTNKGLGHARIASFQIVDPTTSKTLQFDEAFYSLPGTFKDVKVNGILAPIAGKVRAHISGEELEFDLSR